MAETLFARYTNSILHMLPYWFKIRKHSKDSLGARFLNISGLELDDMRYVLDYAYNQCYINSADIGQVDFCYKAIVPMPYKLSNVKEVRAKNVGLIRAESVKDFFGIDIKHVRDNELNTFEKYYLDEKRNIIYVRNKYNADAINDNGKLEVIFKNESSLTVKLIPHHIWNFFDEIGNLVSCPRLFEEPNEEYRKRIIDVFTNPAGASRPGLINGIGRELATRKTVYWHNPLRDLELDDAMIVLNSIRIDKKPADLSQVFITQSGTVLIKADPDSDPDKEKMVSYVYGLEMHQFWNKEDIKLQNELFTVEGKPKNRLKNYIKQINSECPIFWDDFHWNEHYWDMNESDVLGHGYIPNLYDGSINGFESYGYVD